MLAAVLLSFTGAVVADTWVYTILGIPSPTGANNASIFVAEPTGTGKPVSATVQAYNDAGVLGDDPEIVTVPANGFVRLNNPDLALGHDDGGRRVTIRADRELAVTAFRWLAGGPAVALAVHVRRIVTDPEPPGPDDPPGAIAEGAVRVKRYSRDIEKFYFHRTASANATGYEWQLRIVDKRCPPPQPSCFPVDRVFVPRPWRSAVTDFPCLWDADLSVQGYLCIDINVRGGRNRHVEGRLRGVRGAVAGPWRTITWH